MFHPYHSVVCEGAGRNPLSLTRGDCSIHAHLSPEQEFSFVFGKRTERACVRLEANICWAADPPIRCGNNDQIHPWTYPYWLDSTGMGSGLTGWAGLIETIP